jgi:NTE family protein
MVLLRNVYWLLHIFCQIWDKIFKYYIFITQNVSMKALVLGGGSLKGAWQVGVIQAILESGFEPEMIYGISVGSLNASYISNEASRQLIEQKAIDWPQVSKKLIEFWIKNITKPEDIAIMRSKFALGFDTLMSRFDGLLDTSPLHELMRQNLDEFILKNSPIKLKVGAVDVQTTEIVYSSPQEPHFLDYVMASSALPPMMPAVQIGHNHHKVFVDGGLREVTPLRKAIEDGATDIYCVACHAKNIHHKESFYYRSLLKLVDRIRDVAVNQLENTEIDWATNYVEKEHLKGNPIKLSIIRPQDPLTLDLLHFTSDDIASLIVQGFKAGYAVV